MRQPSAHAILNPNLIRLTPCILLLTCLSCTTEEPPPPDPVQPLPDAEELHEIYQQQGAASNVLCGVICLTAYARLVGIDIELEELASNPRYVKLEQGSSLSHLEEAATKLGLYAQPIQNINQDFLKSTQHKLILHVRKQTDTPYNHYELFLGSNNEKASLFDAPNPIYEEDFQSLTSRMSGRGLLLSTQPLEPPKSSRGIKTPSILGGVALLGLALVLLRTGRSPSPPDTKEKEDEQNR